MYDMSLDSYSLPAPPLLFCHLLESLLLLLKYILHHIPLFFQSNSSHAVCPSLLPMQPHNLKTVTAKEQDCVEMGIVFKSMLVFSNHFFV